MTPQHSAAARVTSASRGQPVIALAVILMLWIAVRMTFVAFEGDSVPQAERLFRLTPPPPPSAPLPLPIVAAGPQQEPAAGPIRCDTGLARLSTPPAPLRSEETPVPRPQALAFADFVPRRQGRQAGHPTRLRRELAELAEALPGDAFGDAAQGYTLPAQFAPQPGAEPARAEEGAGNPVRTRGSRWSADGWVLLRADQAPALAAGAAAYGGSQAGAVLRYGFAPRSRLRPQAYMRFSSALGATVQQKEVALGLMVRPVPRLPIAVLGEWRLQEQGGSNRMRPAVMAVTELPPLRLPYGVEGEAYAQGGWAGGRDATPFYDLAATFQRRVARPLRGMQFSAGGGVWSGGQRGAVRLDLGPRVEIRGMVGPRTRRLGVRVGVDWRFRVAGRAEPGSGPVLTVATGF